MRVEPKKKRIPQNGEGGALDKIDKEEDK